MNFKNVKTKEVDIVFCFSWWDNNTKLEKCHIFAGELNADSKLTTGAIAIGE